MIPWIRERIDPKDPLSGPYFDGRPHSVVLFGLTTLLWEIEQAPKDKQRLIVVAAPRSLVWTGYGDPLYLFRRSRVPFASFESHGGRITTVSFRYNDPMDPSSGRRHDRVILSGWQGTAELIASAVRQSKLWKRLETIETDSWDDGGVERVTYDMWATPRYRREVSWRAGNSCRAGMVTFEPSRPIRIATAEVLRRRIGGLLVEEVLSIQLYPDLAGSDYDEYTGRTRVFYSNSNWQHSTRDVPPTLLPPPLFISLHEHTMMRIMPHDGFELKINWV